MISKTSGFEWRYVVNRPIVPGSNKILKLKKSCDNCFEFKELCQMSDGCFACKECSEDIEALTNRLPPKNEREAK